ncbi:NAD-dependent epimerase/dehydratase family protein [Mucilaginibacter ginsenosidivorans]|uniref:NAD-dependent epimerase/dehydratase family protein n=1 Tax=Mucilaginibacter ginsenosidivorans TaxID=398053 RepID=A0A5B8UTJ5_9SPHI|nr:NAD-dependent epimerase/dehydratase family protein [Mucilaginibacter ginsenosidivorans]QEC62430.1 NAD-dependent epimerase/dehydratase family protein [Mucilaginibacter ginsenosidivorans]
MSNFASRSSDISNSSFLITGGAGFIGSNIVRYLINNNAGMVRVLDNFSTGYIQNINDFIKLPNFELITGDIRNLNICKKAIANIDYVSHNAALGSVPRSFKNPIKTTSVNVNGFLNILLTANDARVKKLVYASSSSVYGNCKSRNNFENVIDKQISPYALTKYIDELYAELVADISEFAAIGLRYFNVFGPYQNNRGIYVTVIPQFINAALANKRPIVYGNGGISRDFTYIENVVQANIKGLLSGENVKHEVLNIACGESTTLNELWQIVKNINNAGTSPIYKAARKGDIEHNHASIEKASILIGYKPDIFIKEGLVITNDWFRLNRNWGKK